MRVGLERNSGTVFLKPFPVAADGVQKYVHSSRVMVMLDNFV